MRDYSEPAHFRKRRKITHQNESSVFVNIHSQQKEDCCFKNMTLYGKEAPPRSYHKPNFHNKRFEPLTQSSLSNYTTQSDGGGYARKQHFQYGMTSGGSASNHLIYGNKQQLQLDFSNIKPKENTVTRKYYEAPDSFIYEKDYNNHVQQQEMNKKFKDDEKRKDLIMLKSYKQPWGRPGGGAPKEDHYRTQEVNRLENHKEQIFPFGNPGAGAPLRSLSGSLKANLPADPEIRFQKRERNQVHDIIQPINTSPRQGPFTTNLDILAQETREKRKVMKRDQDMSSSVYDPFGRPGAGAPLRDQNGNFQTARTMNMSRTIQETGQLSKEQLSKEQQNHGTLPYGGRGGNGAPMLDNHGYLVTTHKQTLINANNGAMVRPINDFETSDSYNPWGKGGAGAPLRDDHGNLLTQVNGRFNHDQLAMPSNDYESKRHYLEALQHQAAEHEEYKKNQKEMSQKPSSDTLSWLKRGTVGQPQYDPLTNEIIAQPRVTSDIVKQRLETHHHFADKEKSRHYHEQLDEHFRSMKQKEEDDRRSEREKSVEHTRTMNNIWGKQDHHHSDNNARRKKELDKKTMAAYLQRNGHQGNYSYNNIAAVSHGEYTTEGVAQGKVYDRRAVKTVSVRENVYDGSAIKTEAVHEKNIDGRAVKTEGENTALHSVQVNHTSAPKVYVKTNVRSNAAPFGTELNKDEDPVKKPFMTIAMQRKLMSLQQS